MVLRQQRKPADVYKRQWSHSAMCSGFIAAATDTGKTVLKNQTADGLYYAVRYLSLSLIHISTFFVPAGWFSASPDDRLYPVF